MSLAPIVTALLAAVLGLAWYWRPRQPLEPGVRFLLATYVVLGAWALWFGLYALPGAEPAALLLIKPTVMYWVLAATLFAAPALGWGYPVKAVFGTYFVFSTTEWRWINRGFALFCAVLGAINLVLATGYSRGDWEGFKFSCMVNVLAVFLLRVVFVWIDLLVLCVIALHVRLKALLS